LGLCHVSARVGMHGPSHASRGAHAHGGSALRAKAEVGAASPLSDGAVGEAGVGGFGRALTAGPHLPVGGAIGPNLESRRVNPRCRSANVDRADASCRVSLRAASPHIVMARQRLLSSFSSCSDAALSGASFADQLHHDDNHEQAAAISQSNMQAPWKEAGRSSVRCASQWQATEVWSAYYGTRDRFVLMSEGHEPKPKGRSMAAHCGTLARTMSPEPESRVQTPN
jgi:hypothetical protein